MAHLIGLLGLFHVLSTTEEERYLKLARYKKNYFVFYRGDHKSLPDIGTEQRRAVAPSANESRHWTIYGRIRGILRKYMNNERREGGVVFFFYLKKKVE